MKICKVRKVKTPTRGTSLSAGLDFYVPEDFEKTMLPPGSSINIPSGIHVKLPHGFCLKLDNKSGVSVRTGLMVGATIIDEDYQGEVHLHVRNVGKEVEVIEPGQKLVQGLLIPVSYELVDEVGSLDELYGGVKTERGEGGFGSTGIQ